MAVTLGEFVLWLEGLIPPAFQEHYDNSGLQAGDPTAEIDSVLLSLDVTPAVIRRGCQPGLQPGGIASSPHLYTSETTSIRKRY